MGGEWLVTVRRLGKRRYLYGIAHYMRDGVALCGYVPHAVTRMEAFAADGNEPPPCMRCLKQRDRELIA